MVWLALLVFISPETSIQPIQGRLAHSADSAESVDLAKQAEALLSMADAEVLKIDFDKAEAHYRAAIALFNEKDSHHSSLVRALESLGVLLKSQGFFQKAEHFFRKALSLLEGHQTAHSQYGSLNNHLGSLLMERGDLETANHFFHKALAFENEHQPGSTLSAKPLLHLGRVALRQGHFSKSAEYLNASRAIYRKHAPEGFETTVSEYALGELYLREGKWDKARHYFEAALSLRKQSVPGSLFIAECNYGLGLVAEGEGQIKLAEHNHRQALKLRDQIAPQDVQTEKSWLALGRVLQHQQRAAEASKAYTTSLDIIEQSMLTLGGSLRARSKFMSKVHEHFEAPIKLLIEQNKLKEAYAILERYHSILFFNQVDDRSVLFDLCEYMAGRKRKLDQQLDQTLNQIKNYGGQQSQVSLGQLQQRYLELKESKAALIEEIKYTAPTYANFHRPRFLKPDQILSVTPEQTLIVTYLVGEHETHVFTLSHQTGLQVHKAPVNRQTLTRDILDLRKYIAKPNSATAQSFMHQKAALLYRQLVEPFCKLIKEHERIWLIPDGPLHLLPFTALSKLEHDKPRQFFVEQTPFSVLPSVSAHRHLNRFKSTRTVDKTVVAFGDPAYPSASESVSINTENALLDQWLRSKKTLQPLPFSRMELEKIERTFGSSSRSFRGSQATEASYNQLRGAVPVLHFSCHAYLDPQFPLSSALVLTPTPERTDDGILQAQEIMEQTQAELDTVVLSACETALTDVQGGQGLLGLTRAFQIAGARKVVASLWQVSDLATTVLMAKFYENLKQGFDESVALQQAQQSLLRQGEPLTHPFYWSAFQCYGDSSAKVSK
jgi:CHAT domain-containing protein/Tfp pilus assembly protein PilF